MPQIKKLFALFFICLCATNTWTSESSATENCGSVGQRECDGEYKYYVCNNDSDCDTDHLPPHATAGHCVSAGRTEYKVCTATACNPGFTPTGGWCQQNKTNTTTPAICMFEFADGKTVGPANRINMNYETTEIEFMNPDDDSIQKTVSYNKQLLTKIGDIDISGYTTGVKKIDSAGCKDTDGYTWFAIDYKGKDKNETFECDACDKANEYLCSTANISTGKIISQNPPIKQYGECVKQGDTKESKSPVPPAENKSKESPNFDFAELDTILNDHFAAGSSSEWTNAQGNFNTARLASDSIAGVVLGTVGGIVTSKIIKKNQIKNGFEDLKCTISGQDVASYGDEFTVGVK